MNHIAEIKHALSFVDAHDRETWIKMGAAVKTELGEEGFAIWNDWSATASNYNPKDARYNWNTLIPNRVNIGTLFHEARQKGYQYDSDRSNWNSQDMRDRFEARAKRAEEAIQQQLAAQKRMEIAKQRANEIWNQALPADPNHPYLVKKGILPEQIKKIRQKDEQLIIPIGKDKKIYSLMFIDQSGKKRFLAGGKVKGNGLIIGDASNIKKSGYMIAEGFATAATINQATGLPVVISFSANNLSTVCQAMNRALPNTPFVIAADNDNNGTGIEKANQALLQLTKHLGFRKYGKAIKPEFSIEDISEFQRRYGTEAKPTDFNDLAVIHGIDAVKAKLIPEINQQFNRGENMTDINLDQNRMEPDPSQKQKKTMNDEQETPKYKTNSNHQSTENEAQHEDPMRKKYIYVKGKYYDRSAFEREDPKGVTDEDVAFKETKNGLLTTRVDEQTIKDMLIVAQAKGWKPIKLFGSKEFRQMAYIEAESQGIKTTGYMPTRKNEIDYVEGKIEQKKQAFKTAPNKTKSNPSHDQTEATRRAAHVEDMVIRSSTPTTAQINSSVEADTNLQVQPSNIGGSSIPSEVLAQTAGLKQTVTEQQVNQAKGVYDKKSEQLSVRNLTNLKAYERTTMEVVQRMSLQFRALARLNFFDTASKFMNGQDLHLPEPKKAELQNDLGNSKPTKEKDINRSISRTR